MGGQKEVEEGGLKNEAGNAVVSFGEVQHCTCTFVPQQLFMPFKA